MTDDDDTTDGDVLASATKEELSAAIEDSLARQKAAYEHARRLEALPELTEEARTFGKELYAAICRHIDRGERPGEN